MSALPPAAGALIFFAARSLRNAATRRLRRLAEPRYLIGFAIGLAYVGFVLFSPRGAPRRGAAVPAGLEFTGAAQLFAAAALLVAAALVWIFRGREASLTLTEGEAQFLFSAPLTRRAVVHFALLRSQLRVLWGALVALLFSRPGSAGGFLRAVIGGWLLFSVVNLHLLGVGFTKAAWEERPAARRRGMKLLAGLLALAAIALVVTAGTAALLRAAEAVPSRRGFSPVAIEGAVVFGPLGRPLLAALLPFRALLRPSSPRRPSPSSRRCRARSSSSSFTTSGSSGPTSASRTRRSRAPRAVPTSGRDASGGTSRLSRARRSGAPSPSSSPRRGAPRSRSSGRTWRPGTGRLSGRSSSASRASSPHSSSGPRSSASPRRTRSPASSSSSSGPSESSSPSRFPRASATTCAETSSVRTS